MKNAERRSEKQNKTNRSLNETQFSIIWGQGVNMEGDRGLPVGLGTRKSQKPDSGCQRGNSLESLNPDQRKTAVFSGKMSQWTFLKHSLGSDEHLTCNRML